MKDLLKKVKPLTKKSMAKLNGGTNVPMSYEYAYFISPTGMHHACYEGINGSFCYEY